MWNATHVEGPQERIGIRIAAYQDRAVLVPILPSLDALSDLLGHPVSFAAQRVQVHVLSWPALGVRGPEPFVERMADLQAVGVVVLDEAVAGIEDRLWRAVVAGEDELRRLRIDVQKVQDVADGRPAELVDGLVVIAHHGNAVWAGVTDQVPHQLELRVVGILELVHQDVLETLPVLAQDYR